MAKIDEEAKQLAEKHYELEVGMRNIIRLTQEGSVEIRRANGATEKIGLLEVNENTIPAGVMPIEFAPVPASGVNYPTMIVEVTPEEYEQIKAKELALPGGWRLGAEIPRPIIDNGQ